jgi:uncharacterized protein with PQ loop repeat
VSLISTCTKILRTKSSKDFSIPAQTLTLTGIAFLFIYATHLMITEGNKVLFAQNLINLVTNSISYILVLKYRHGPKDTLRSPQR